MSEAQDRTLQWHRCPGGYWAVRGHWQFSAIRRCSYYFTARALNEQTGELRRDIYLSRMSEARTWCERLFRELQDAAREEP